METQYTAWIAENVCDNGYGKCREWSHAMAVCFPELRLVRGHYYCPTWGERTHWWLVDSDGRVVDPTAKQFPSKGLGKYVEWDDSKPEPTGMCPNCGGECFDGAYICSDACGRSYVAYCNSFR